MRILITGANGMIGASLMQHLSQRGFDVRGSLRSQANLKSLYSNVFSEHFQYTVVGDIHQNTDWTNALEGVDVIVHTAACVHQIQGSSEYNLVNNLGTQQLAKQAILNGVKRMIFLSSIKAIGEQGHFERSTTPNPKDEYGQSKLDAEQKLIELLQQSSMEIVILRLPLIYGPGVKANFRKLIQMVKFFCQWGIPVPFKGVNNQRSMMGLNNLVDLITCCINHPNAAGKIYLPSDGEPISTSELMQKIARAFGKSISLFFIPSSLLTFSFGIMGQKKMADRLFGDLTLDSQPIHDDLLWTAPYTVEEELCHAVDTFKYS